MGAAIHRTREQVHAPLTYEEFNFKDWHINPKGISKSLVPFDDSAAHYRTWRSRVTDHLMASNQSWGRVLELVERQRAPLSKERLAGIGGVDDAPMDLNKISAQLWSFLGQYCLGNKVYDRRLQLTNGEDFNGLELWRRLFLENQGGAEHVMLAGIRRLHRFPRCPSKAKLGGYLREWLTLQRQYGGYLPDEYLWVMRWTSFLKK